MWIEVNTHASKQGLIWTRSMVASLILATSLLVLFFIVPCVCMGMLDNFTAVQPKTHVFLDNILQRQVSVSLDNQRNCSTWQRHQQQIVGRLGCLIVILVKWLPYLFRGTYFVLHANGACLTYYRNTFLVTAILLNSM